MSNLFKNMYKLKVNKIMQTKLELRSSMRVKRRDYISNVVEGSGIKLLEQLLPLLEDTKKIAIYYSADGEINLRELMDYCARRSIELYAPVATRSSRSMRFELITDLCHRDIFYPENYELETEIKWYNLDLVILPLLAVDHLGYRLGQGGGYYDTTFAKRQSRPLLCGVGYSWQLCEQVPHESWDLKLDYFASESDLVKF